MNEWIPVIGTLLGAIVAGAISLIVVRLSNNHAMKHSKLLLGEERARWATETKLESLKDFYGSVEALLEATGQFRIQQAWETSEEKDGIRPPKWVVPYDKARKEFEDSLHKVYLKACLLDKDIEDEFGIGKISDLRWFVSKTKDEGVKALVSLESDLKELRSKISRRFRKTFEDREKGHDVIA